MLSQKIENWFVLMDAAQVTEYFIWATVAVLLLAIFEAVRGRHSGFLEYAPTLMTSLGILGTFTGIVVGLLHFDTGNIDKSIPLLLDGLKTAFITSIVGMSAAMGFNFLDAWLFSPRRAASGAPVDVTPRDIFQSMEDQKAVLKTIAAGLAGQEEGSLIGQMKLLRQGVTDFQKQHETRQAEFAEHLWKEMQNFSEMLSRSATAQIIQALEQVIREFNDKLSEQFGENFKRLDESVKKLVEWQAAYKDQVEKMGEQYQQSVDSLVQTRTAVAGIWEECKEIPLAMEGMRDVLEVNQHQIAELQRHLEAFVRMRDAAVEAVPTIQQQVEEIATRMVNGATTLQDTLGQTGERMLENSMKMQVALSEGADHFRDSVTQTQQSFADMSRSVASSSEKLTDTMDDTIRGLHETARAHLDTMRKSVDEMGSQLQRHSGDLTGQLANVVREAERTSTAIISEMVQSGNRTQQQVASTMESLHADFQKSASRARGEMDAHVSASLEKFASVLNKKLELFETTTMRELNSEMEVMGKALTSVTKRFVEDYKGLVGAMDKVVRQQPGRGN